ncbi:unnamed protein product, partial [marine sediment metagenome]
MSIWLAILFSAGILTLCYTIGALTELYFVTLLIMVLGTASWAASDSSKIELKKYKTGLAKTPIGIFFEIILIWIIAFPWYLAVRGKINK